MADGFLGRWSRRKLDVKQGKPLPPEPLPARQEPVPQAARQQAAVLPAGAAPAVLPAAAPGPAPVHDEAPPALTLDDVKMLTRESDYSAFARRGVDPEVRNAAMKKLFTDPHYNVMDGLDIYIDDYSKPDPIPATMLRQMASARFLNLFDEQEKEPAGSTPGAGPVATQEPAGTTDALQPPLEVADNPTLRSVAQSGSDGDAAAPVDRITPDHADPDLRLQQDDASAGGAARGSAS